MKKSTKILLIILAVIAIAGVVMYFTGLFDKLDISASTNTTTSQKGILTITDDASSVKENQDLTFKIKVDLVKAESAGLMGEFIGRRRTVYIQAFLAGGQNSSGEEIVSRPNYITNLTDVINSRPNAVELTVSAKVPQGVALKDNKLVSKVKLFGGYRWAITLDEATDTDLIDYTQSLTDLQVVSFANNGSEFLLPDSASQKTTTFSIGYKNAGPGVADQAVLKLRVPKNKENTGSTMALNADGAKLSSETVNGANYAVITWELGSLAPGATGSKNVTATANKQSESVVTVIPHAEISTTSRDSIVTNNKKIIDKAVIIISSSNVLRSRGR